MVPGLLKVAYWTGFLIGQLHTVPGLLRKSGRHQRVMARKSYPQGSQLREVDCPRAKITTKCQKHVAFQQAEQYRRRQE